MRLPWKLIGLGGLAGVAAVRLAGSRRRRHLLGRDDPPAALQAPFGPVTSNGDQAARTSTRR